MRRNRLFVSLSPSFPPSLSCCSIAASLVLLVTLTACFGAPGYEGPHSPHHDDDGFHNVPRTAQPDGWDVLAWQLEMPNGAIPWRDAPPVRPVRPAPRVERGIRVTFVNHATVLVQMDGVSVLTDPIWSDRVGPVSFAGPPRQADPGIRFEDLPKIDAVVISHSHYDHCDAVTLRRLHEKFGMPIFAGLGSVEMLRDLGVEGGRDFDWWQSAPVAKGVAVTMTPAQHGSQRGLGDRNVVLWGGYWLEGPSGKVFFAGDTALGPHFAEIHRKLGAPTVALLPIGAYEPRWFMQPVHMSPADAVQAHLALGAAHSLGIHWGTFDLSDEGRYQPAGDLDMARRKAMVPANGFVAMQNGDVIDYAGR